MTVFVWLILCAIWGSTWIFIKKGLVDPASGSGLPPITFATARFAIAAVVLAIIIIARRLPLPRGRAQWSLMLVTGLLQFTINYSMVFWGETRISSGLASVLQGMISVFGLGLAWYFLPQERINGLKVLAVLIGFAGVGVIFSDQIKPDDLKEFSGSAAIVFGAFSAALASILIKAKAQGIHPATMAFSQMVLGLPILIFYSFAVEGNPFEVQKWSTISILCVLHLAIVGTVVAFWLYYWLLSKIESTRAMMLSLVTPVIAVIVGASVGDESFPPQILLGGSLILGCIALILVRTHRRKMEPVDVHLTT